MNTIIPFKGRQINSARPVRVYRNLHAKDDSCKYSVKQGNLVVGHTNLLMLADCQFIVNGRLRDEVRATGRKKVHAFIKGKLSDSHGGPLHGFDLPNKVNYNPYLDNTFRYFNYLTGERGGVFRASSVQINQEGVSAIIN